MTVFFFVLEAGGWYQGDFLARTAPLYLQATTACLGAIVVAQVMNVFLCRHPLKSSFSFGRLAGNPLILLGIAVEIAMLLFIVYTQAGNWLFATAPVGGAVWLLAVALAFLMVGAEEARKAWMRRVQPG